MLQQLLPLLGTAPENITMFLEIAAVISIFAIGLWLMGARYSRQIITLFGVAGGTIAGKHLPELMPVSLSAPVIAVVAALICGVVAFVTHRFWIGLALGMGLAWWASLGTWALMHGEQSWSQPVWDADMNIRRFGEELWTVLPPDVTRILPWAAGSAMISGIALATLWPKLAAALNWSLAGVTLLLCTGLAAATYARPEWLGMLPAQTWAQLTSFVGLVMFGVVVQWKLAPRGAVRVAKPAPTDG